MFRGKHAAHVMINVKAVLLLVPATHAQKRHICWKGTAWMNAPLATISCLRIMNVDNVTHYVWNAIPLMITALHATTVILSGIITVIFNVKMGNSPMKMDNARTAMPDVLIAMVPVLINAQSAYKLTTC